MTIKNAEIMSELKTKSAVSIFIIFFTDWELTSASASVLSQACRKFVYYNNLMVIV